MKLSHSSVETVRWFRRPQLWATGDWHFHHDNISAHASRLTQSFSAKHHIIQVTQPHYSPYLARWDFCLFPKLKITFKVREREEISDCQWDSGKYNRAVDGKWKNWVRSLGAYFEGDWGFIVLCTVVLVPCSLFNKCLYFSYHIPCGQTSYVESNEQTELTSEIDTDS